MGAFCLAHGIISDNEDKESWTAFFQFVVRVYPSLDDQANTIVSDRDKGLLRAFTDTFSDAGGFQCSRHEWGVAGMFPVAGEYPRLVRTNHLVHFHFIFTTKLQRNYINLFKMLFPSRVSSDYR